MFQSTVAWSAPLTGTVVSVAFDKPISPSAIAEHVAELPTGPNRLLITIDTRQAYQTIEGIGGAFNENGGEALTHLATDDRRQVLESLFTATNSAAFTFCRLPIGASDFALSAYSHADEPDDYELRHFSIDRDRKHLIPYIQAALALNPRLRLHASPWSPPGWLKTTGKMPGGGRLRDEPRVYRTYATYLRRSVEAYAAEKIRIDRLFVQNEPNIEIKFPSCQMPPEQMVRFVVEYLAPEFAAHSVGTEIWAGTFQESREHAFAHDCFADRKFRQAVRGAGFQYSDPTLIKDLLVLYPHLNVMHTEARCQDGANSVDQAHFLFGEIVRNFQARCTVFTYWNMILNEEQISTWNWRQNSLITIDREKRAVRYNPDYAVMAVLGRAVRPGARWLMSSSKSLQPVVSFRNPDDSIVTLVWNDGDAIACELVTGEERTQVVLPARSFCAVRLMRNPASR